MKKFVLSLAMCSAFGAALVGGIVRGSEISAFADDKLFDGCKSAYLCDYYSGECIYKSNELERLPIASVCKVMTLTLCLDALDCGKISLSDSVTVSANAAGMGGSQVFLQSGLSYTYEQLLKSIVVCSANDSCVAVAESLCGSEQTFVSKMNEKAKELGCGDTLFANCTGLPKPTQYSCAKDVALMYRNLIGHEEYFKYSKIWLEDFNHPDNRTTSMTNTNKLIRRYSSCDGGKTGYTGEAGFCLASTAKRDNLRLVSVVLGATTSDDRFDGAIKMFDYGFANYTNKLVLDKDVNLPERLTVSSGKKPSISVRPERSSYMFSKSDSTPNVTTSVILNDLKAPLSKGEVVGKIEIYKDGIIYDTVAVVASEDVLKADYGDNLRKTAENWAL